MFKLQDIEKSSYQTANDFYNYAKGLAILRENLHQYNHAEESSRKATEEVTKAMRALVKQIQE